jgi:hypothetical protein
VGFRIYLNRTEYITYMSKDESSPFLSLWTEMRSTESISAGQVVFSNSRIIRLCARVRVRVRVCVCVCVLVSSLAILHMALIYLVQISSPQGGTRAICINNIE